MIMMAMRRRNRYVATPDATHPKPILVPLKCPIRKENVMRIIDHRTLPLGGRDPELMPTVLREERTVLIEEGRDLLMLYRLGGLIPPRERSGERYG
jgi:hypothetical protein